MLARASARASGYNAYLSIVKRPRVFGARAKTAEEQQALGALQTLGVARKAILAHPAYRAAHRENDLARTAS